MKIFLTRKTKTKMFMKMRINIKLSLHLQKMLMDQKLKSLSETTKRLFFKKVKTEIQSFTFQQVSEKPALLLLPCIIISHTPKKRKLSSLLILFNLSNSKLKPLKELSMGSFKKNPFAKKSTKNMEETKFSLTGIGKELTDKLSVFMAKKTKISDRQKRKKYKAVLCLRRNF